MAHSKIVSTQVLIYIRMLSKQNHFLSSYYDVITDLYRKINPLRHFFLVNVVTPHLLYVQFRHLVFQN